MGNNSKEKSRQIIDLCLQLMRDSVTKKNLISLTTDPVGPQPQMRKIVEILTKLEKYVESIFPDTDPIANLKSEKSSDSSKRSYR